MDHDVYNTYLSISKGDKQYRSDEYLKSLIYHNKLDIIKLLLNLDPDIFDNHKYIKIAINYGHVDIVRLLMNEDIAKDNNILFDTIRLNKIEILKVLIEYGANINNGLMIAINLRNFDIIKVLVNSGAVFTSRELYERAYNTLTFYRIAELLEYITQIPIINQ